MSLYSSSVTLTNARLAVGYKPEQKSSSGIEGDQKIFRVKPIPGYSHEDQEQMTPQLSRLQADIEKLKAEIKQMKNNTASSVHSIIVVNVIMILRLPIKG